MPDRKDSPKSNQRTTPYGTPERPHTETELGFPTPSLGPLAERYELLEELGRGGMGIVYKARDKETDEVVALKVLRPEIAARPDLIERFKSELRLARKITHKNVCRTYELLRFGDTVVIAMEYVQGESLRHFLERFGTVPLRRGLEWAGQICSALAEAHAQGVVHRDLKPENIVITQDGAVKVMDFGIARSLDADATAAGMLIGTPAYMSPEQAEGKPVDPRSDIYSLGLVMYEMFTGRRAFAGDTPVALFVQHIQESPQPPGEVEPLLPNFLDQAITKCLEKRPQNRFQSVGELSSALQVNQQTTTSKLPSKGDEVPLPLNLTCLQKSDFGLLAAALVAAIVSFTLLEDSFPARRLQLGIGRQVAEKLASDFARRLDLSMPTWEKPELRVFGWGELLWRYGRDATYSSLDSWQPIRWRVHAKADDNASGSVISVDASSGDFIGYERESSELPALTLSAPAIEELRQRANAKIEAVYGISPTELLVETENLGIQEGQWAYTLVLTSVHPLPGTRLEYQFQIIGGHLAYLWREHVFTRELTSKEKLLLQGPGWWGTAGTVIQVLIALFLLLLLRRTLLLHWRETLILSLVYGLAHTLMVLDSAPDTLVISFAWHSAFAFVIIGGGTSILSRRFPERAGLLDGVVSSRAHRFRLALGIIRGTLLGFPLMGLLVLVSEFGAALNVFWVDPLAIANTTVSKAPPFHAFANSTTESLELVFLGVLFPLLFSVKVLRFRLLSVLIVGLWSAVLFTGSVAWLEPWPANFVWLVLLGIILAMIFLKFELVTVLTALFTLELWVMGFPNWLLFRQIGSDYFYVIFLAWLFILFLSIWSYWSESIARGYRRVTAVFE